jgi:choline kinase
MVKGVILAAGDGTRFGAVRKQKPKVLAAVAGRPLIRYVLDVLGALPLKEIIIVIGHLGDLVRQTLGASANGGVPLRYVRSANSGGGNGVSLDAAREAVGQEGFALAMGDHVLSGRMAHRLLSSGLAGCTLCVDFRPRPAVQLDEATRVWVDRGGMIRRIGKNLPWWNGVDTGFFWLTPVVFRALDALREAGRKEPTVSDACRVLIERGPGMKACDVSGLFWTDVDTPEDVRRAERAVGRRPEKHAAVATSGALAGSQG